MTIRTVHGNLLQPRHLSTIWIYVLLSIAFRDIHEFFREGMIPELASDSTVNGSPVRDSTLLVAGIAGQAPLAMVVLSRVLPRRANRLANQITAALTALGILAFWPKDGDDLVFGFFQLAALAAVGVICHRWVADAEDIPTTVAAQR